EDQGDYSTAVSRILNVMKAGIANITSEARETELEELDIDIQFTSILPDNLLETVQILTEANGGKPIMSQETSVASNPLVTDSDEMEKIKAEKEPSNPIPETFNL